MEELLYNHPDIHEPSSMPIKNCQLCDIMIKKPIKRCFGLDVGSTVIPNNIIEKEKEDINGQ